MNHLFLHTCLDHIQWIVHQRTHPSAQTSQQQTLPMIQLHIAHGSIPPVLLPLPLPGNNPLLAIIVHGKVHGLVATLPQHGRDHALVQRSQPLLPRDEHGRLRDVLVLRVRPLLRIHEAVILALHPNLANLRGRHDRDGLRQSRQEAGDEGHPRGRRLPGSRAGISAVPAVYVVPIVLEAHEAYGHLGHDSRVHGREALVQREGTLALDDPPGRAERSEGGDYHGPARGG
mmetsp:Transcript_7215/g.17947  ORF Transcript_7215/g.17947 Transcript_7215/m.17947 type:complete len:230 (-) Transcript_7215:1231-1920(-)